MSKKDNLFNFQIKSVKTVEFCITPPDRKIEKGEKINYNLKTEFLVNIEKNIVALRLIIKMFEDKDNKLITSIKTENYFEIDNLVQFLKKDDANSLDLPQLLLSALINISIGTARGILIAKVGGTLFDQMVLPVIPTKVLIPSKPIKLK